MVNQVSCGDGIHAPRYVWRCAKHLMRGGGGDLLDEALPAAVSHSKPKFSCGNGFRAQVCMTLCEAFNGRDLQIRDVTPSPPSC